jgi:hypothetical protein
MNSRKLIYFGLALVGVKGGAKVDHWGGAKGYQQRE